MSAPPARAALRTRRGLCRLSCAKREGARVLAARAPPVDSAAVDQKPLEPVSPRPELAFVAVQLLAALADHSELAFDVVERLGGELAPRARIVGLLRAPAQA